MRIFRNFRIQIIIRICALSILSLLLFFILFESNNKSAALFIGCLILLVAILLIRYVEKTQQNMQRFLEALRYDDYSQSFSPKHMGRSFDELNIELSKIMSDIHQSRSEKEEQFHYLRTVVQHISIGLIIFTADGKVDLINNACKRLLKVTGLKNIQTLKTNYPELVNKILAMKTGDRILEQIENSGDSLQLAISVTEFRIRSEQYKMITLQNIRSELEEKEMEAWQNMIRVLTHEIMNSITPISSLASTVNGMIPKAMKPPADNGYSKLPHETMTDIQNALQTIYKRSQGLLHFVGAYRNLTLIPNPRFEIFSISDLFNRVSQLMEQKVSREKIDFKMSIEPESLELTADPELTEQVLINLVLNAIDAVREKKNPKIVLDAIMDDFGRIQISINDNGPGITPEAMEKIFVPFFTTKKTGSGIGLSLSRQIMRLHKGTIKARTVPGGGTTFTLRF
jgi:signal transduction histidine kinase